MKESNKRLKTKRIIENAMVQLLTEQPFDQISTVKLAEKAGISRSSFYTHYKDKYDMIEHYQSKLFHTFEYIFQKHANYKRDAILEVFEYLESEPLLASLLSENGTTARAFCFASMVASMWAIFATTSSTATAGSSMRTVPPTRALS